MITTCITIIPFCAGFLLDLLFGDPHDLWHPVRSIGKMISMFEKLLRKLFPTGRTGELCGGIFLVILVCCCTGGISAALLYCAYLLHPAAGIALESYMYYTLLAARSLRDESMAVLSALEGGSVSAGRKAVSMIVGRDTERLDEAGVIRAAVETVAENTSDGVVAPMLFMALGGPAAGYVYKAVNTMDSMVGYKNKTYLYFGRAAAKTDDFFNFIPSRISAFFMLICCLLPGYDIKNAFRIYRRDRRRHKSPNAAQTESVMAGALRVRLLGDAWYFGEKYEKPFIGDDLRPVEKEDIKRSVRLMYAASLLAFAVCLILRLLLKAAVIFFIRF